MLNIEDYHRWKATRPPKIQEAMTRFPFGRYRLPDGREAFLRSWGETNGEFRGLSFSEINPEEDYEAFASPANALPICPEHFDHIELLEPYYKQA